MPRNQTSTTPAPDQDAPQTPDKATWQAAERAVEWVTMIAMIAPAGLLLAVGATGWLAAALIGLAVTAWPLFVGYQKSVIRAAVYSHRGLDPRLKSPK